MKTNNKSFIYSSLETLLLAIVIGILTVWAVKGEDNFDFNALNALNGLFTPTQSERFFQAGREDFEREVEIFNHPEHYLSDDLLQIDPEMVEQMDRSRNFPNFNQENVQFKLYLDVAK